MKKIDCSIIIVNWKSISFLINCIDSINNETRCSYEIIVIDNASGINEQNELKNIDGIKLILNSENLGFAAANNQGIQISSGNYIFILNPDTIILDNSIDKMIAFLNNNTSIHAVGPKLYYSEKLDYHPSIKKFPTPFKQLLWMLPFSGSMQNLIATIFFDKNKIQRVDCVWGAAIMFKKQVFDNIGYLDEQFFIYAEEVDFCKRVADAGMKLYYFPEAEVIHYGGKSQEKASAHKNSMLWTSLMLYFEKYYTDKVIKFYMYVLMHILKIKIILFKKNDLSTIVNIINQKLRGEKI